MVLDLCLPHFYTTVHCNKLCADGYDVTNLVSADPALRRRGFKLEYFLRPPVQVTLKFGFQVELCRVDVELWPCGMDGGQTCKRLEISTSSDQLPSHNSGSGRKQINEKKQMQGEDQNEQRREKQQSHQCNGHQWSLQARQWGQEAVPEPQQKDHVSKCQSNATNPEPQYKLVGRCELRQETRVCFTRSNFRPCPPFPSPPPPQPADCREVELWRHGLLSLGAVTHLRVTVPFGGAASALGLKALVVWGTPSRCCPPEEVERIRRVHEASERQKPRFLSVASSVSHTKPAVERATLSSNISIPEEFLDPITQELMMLPMLLPSGMSVDRTTLEEHQKREATWGRPPNDPFTGVPFTSTSQPLPNPHLKSRIDHFLLQSSLSGRDGMLGRQGDGQNPQSSRLIASRVDEQNQNSSCVSKSSTNSTAQYHTATRNTSNNMTVQNEGSALKHSSDIKNQTSNSQPLGGDSKSLTGRKRDLNKDSPPQTKRPRNDAVSLPSCSSHEQRLSASLDEALLTALQGRPSFTSNLSQQKQVSLVSKPGSPSQQGQTASEPPDEKRCSACACSVSIYSKAASSIYRLTCGHLLCRSCLQKESKPLNTVTTPTSNSILCAACQSLTLRRDIVRVHH